MQKGKLGICLWVYPLLAFLLAIFGQPLMCLVLFLFALGAEKDEWAARQTLQAFLLALVSSLMDYVFGTLLGAVTNIPFVGGVIGANLPVGGFTVTGGAFNTYVASGRVEADAVAGGIIGYNRLLAAKPAGVTLAALLPTAMGMALCTAFTALARALGW